MSKETEILEALLRENYGKIVYSHKTQIKCAEILTKRNNRLKLLQIIVSALVTTGLLIRILSKSSLADLALILSTILSALNFFLTTYTKEFNLGEIIEKHNSSALELWNIRERYLALISDLKIGVITLEQVTERRDKLHEELIIVYKGAPLTFSKAYKAAQKALQESDELTFSNEEIDKLLPQNLRRTKK